MQKFIPTLTETLVASLAISVAVAIAPTGVEAAGLIQRDLFFGRNIAGGGQVSDAEFEAFVDSNITPRFPDGLTIFAADGQFLDSTNTLVREPANVVTLFTEDSVESELAVSQIVAEYLETFNQESVLQVTNRDEFNVGFGAGENVIDNDIIPEFIRAELFFGRNIPGGGVVSQEQFQVFVDDVITPRFPAGLTIVDTDGQFRDSSNTIIEEESKSITLLLEDTVENETAIDEIITAYIQQFNQESVLLAVNEELAVGFGAGENLIDNDPTPEFIQADLFFGRNIPGGGQVSEAAFEAFLDSVITPRFPAGLTVFNGNGQFQDSTNTIVEEPSKVVRLLLEDTIANETAIDEIITRYTQQFNQESVLLVVDEELTVAFDATHVADVPEPGLLLGLSALGIFVIARRISR